MRDFEGLFDETPKRGLLCGVVLVVGVVVGVGEIASLLSLSMKT